LRIEEVMEIATSILEVSFVRKNVLNEKTSIRTHTADASIHSEEKTGSEDQETTAWRTLHQSTKEW